MQRINTIHFYKGMLVPAVDLEDPRVKYVLDRLAAGESAGMKNKKLRGHYVWKARIDDCNRLLYTKAYIKGERRIVVLTVTAHQYDTCPFLQPDYLRNFMDHHAIFFDAAVTEDDFIDDDSDQECENNNNNNNIEKTKFEYTPIDCFNGKLIALSEDQTQAKHRTLPLVIMGPAGSGKSCNALSMINDFVSEQVGAKEMDDIIYVTQSPDLCEAMKNNWKSYPLSQQIPKDKVRFVTYQELIASPLNQVGFDEFNIFIEALVKKLNTQQKAKQASAKKNKEQAAKEEALSLDWMPSFTKGKKLDPELLYQEMRIISGCLSSDDYKDNYGSDQSLCPKEFRKSLYKIYEEYLKHLNGNGKIDLGCCLPVVTPRKVRLIIDEAQDLAHVQLKLLCDLSRGEIVYFLDPRQSLSDTLKKKHYTDRILKAKETGAEPIELKSSYRCPKEILDIAQEMLCLGAKLTGESVPKPAISMVDHPGVVRFVEKIPEDLANFAVVTLPELVEQAKMLYKTNRVFTIDQIKGLEYEHIVTHCIFDNKTYFNACVELSNPLDKNKVYGSAFFRPYTAFTRATRYLTIVENNPDCVRKLEPIIATIRKSAKETNENILSPSTGKNNSIQREAELFDEIKQLVSSRNPDNIAIAENIWINELKKQHELFIKFKQRILGESQTSPQTKKLPVTKVKKKKKKNKKPVDNISSSHEVDQKLINTNNALDKLFRSNNNGYDYLFTMRADSNGEPGERMFIQICDDPIARNYFINELFPKKFSKFYRLNPALSLERDFPKAIRDAKSMPPLFWMAKSEECVAILSKNQDFEKWLRNKKSITSLFSTYDSDDAAYQGTCAFYWLSTSLPGVKILRKIIEFHPEIANIVTLAYVTTRFNRLSEHAPSIRDNLKNFAEDGVWILRLLGEMNNQIGWLAYPLKESPVNEISLDNFSNQLWNSPDIDVFESLFNEKYSIRLKTEVLFIDEKEGLPTFYHLFTVPMYRDQLLAKHLPMHYVSMRQSINANILSTRFTVPNIGDFTPLFLMSCSENTSLALNSWILSNPLLAATFNLSTLFELIDVAALLSLRLPRECYPFFHDKYPIVTKPGVKLSAFTLLSRYASGVKFLYCIYERRGDEMLKYITKELLEYPYMLDMKTRTSRTTEDSLNEFIGGKSLAGIIRRYLDKRAKLESFNNINPVNQESSLQRFSLLSQERPSVQGENNNNSERFKK